MYQVCALFTEKFNLPQVWQKYPDKIVLINIGILMHKHIYI